MNFAASGIRLQIPRLSSVKEESDLCTDGCLAAVTRSYTLCRRRIPSVPAVAPSLVGEGIDVYFIGYHECGIKTKTEMTDHLIFVCLVFVFLKKISRTGESDLCDVFFDFVCCHTKTGIDEFQ